MNRIHFIFFPAFLTAMILISFQPAAEMDLPVKSISRAVEKIWGVDDFNLKACTDKNCSSNGCWYEVIHEEACIGMIYAGRVNSCRSGGCSIDAEDEEKLSFEYFEYFLLADHSGKVLWVKVHNYQATQGHEVMSRGWLNQFKGLSMDKKITVGEDIETISGATISVNAITDDIQQVISCLTAM